MREVDTEAPVVWPAWCYSANTQESAIDVISRKGDPASELLPATSPTSYVQPSPNTILSGYGGGLKNRSRRKNPFTTSLASTSNSLSVTSVPSTSPSALVGDTASITNEKLQQHLQLSSFLINKKMLSERILMGFSGSSLDSVNSNNSTSDNLNSNNSSSSNNNNNNNTSSANNRKSCDSNTTISVYDKIKNEVQIMDSSMTNSGVAANSLKNGDLTTNNNGSTSGSGGGATVNLVASRIKNERLSPPLNGDVQSSISRSRSATPTSFPGTPPQTCVHPSDLTTTANILNTSRTNEFQARNYSDFMRSLAAKYNNTNPNDASTARNLFFDQKFSSASTKPPSKEPPSPPEVKRTSVPTPPQVPFVPPLFSGLPFSSAVFPPLIDMSSTQALVTLARAAKEAELQKILCQTQKRPGAAAPQSLSPALRSVIASTQQQLAQFNAQSLLLPSQFPVPQRSPSGRSPRSSQSPQQYRGEPGSSVVAPTPATPSSHGSSAKRPSSPPLDLSATQQSKRLKVESATSSPATSPPVSSILATTTSTPGNAGASSHTKSKTDSPAVATSSNVEFPRHCRAQSDEISSWSVDDVCNFVNSIDICAEYVQKFRDQCIDGSGLPLLTEDHLTNSLGMKLGPALKLRSVLAKMLGGPCPCVSCSTLYQQQQQQQQQQLIVQHQKPTPAIHLTPPRVASSSTISSSSSSGGSTTSSSSSSSSANSNTNNAAIINSSNNTNNTAGNLSTTSSSAGGAIGLVNASNPVRPASADSGS